MKPKYWAVGYNFSYSIEKTYGNDQPDFTYYGSAEGPFNTLSQAKTHIRLWIKSDLFHLKSELKSINSLKVKDIV